MVLQSDQVGKQDDCIAFGATAAQTESEDVARPAVGKRLASIRERLPASWSLVFGSRIRGIDVRQELWPLSATGPGQELAAARLAHIGIDDTTIQAATGVTLSG